MPTIYLSPSTQEYNQFVIGGTEEEYMNRIVDAMIPYLEQYGIDYARNTPDMTAASSIRESNAGNYDFHIAIHSNASGPGQEGENRGVIIFYYPTSQNGLRMAEILQSNFRGIYPLPDQVTISPTTTLGEVSRTRAPSVLIEVAYHDNYDDANWIADNINLIALAISNSIRQYFNTQSANTTPSNGNQNQDRRVGRVTLSSGYLNIRREPSLNAPVIGMAPNGAEVTVLDQVGNWYHISYDSIDGYVYDQYLRVQ